MRPKAPASRSCDMRRARSACASTASAAAAASASVPPDRARVEERASRRVEIDVPDAAARAHDEHALRAPVDLAPRRRSTGYRLRRQTVAIGSASNHDQRALACGRRTVRASAVGRQSRDRGRLDRRLVGRRVGLRPEPVEPRDARQVGQLGGGLEPREEVREALAVDGERRDGRAGCARTKIAAAARNHSSPTRRATDG